MNENQSRGCKLASGCCLIVMLIPVAFVLVAIVANFVDIPKREPKIENSRDRGNLVTAEDHLEAEHEPKFQDWRDSGNLVTAEDYLEAEIAAHWKNHTDTYEEAKEQVLLNYSEKGDLESALQVWEKNGSPRSGRSLRKLSWPEDKK